MTRSVPGGAREAQPWTWPDTRWRQAVARVRAGRALRKPWPEGNRVCVALSFDSDHETIALRDGDTAPGRLSQGEYGSRVALPRILTLLAGFNAPASFFVPAVSALLHESDITACIERGHEIALHGWIHEWTTLLDLDTEAGLLQRSLSTLERLSGMRPLGIRTPSWDFSEHTLGLIRDAGLTYDSSLMADDEPYEIVADGMPTGIVEIPVEWIRDDAPYLTMDRYTASRPYTAPRTVLQIWTDEFDAAYAASGLFQLTMHPHVIGHRSRIVVLESLLEHIARHDGVWFARHDRLAEHVRTELQSA